jgi:hypothetical protein
VAVVSVHYYESYLDASVRAAADLARRARAQVFVAVANHPDVAERLPKLGAMIDVPRVVHIAHDNTGLEFGAYQAGIESLSALDPDCVLILNDTFSLHRYFSRGHRRRLLDALDQSGDAPCAAGEVEALARSFSILGCRTHRWITSSVFALNRAALHALGGRLYRPEVDALVTGLADSERFFSPDLDPVLASHIRAWLLVPREPGTWYAAAPVDAVTAPRLAAKARSILQEMSASAVLEEATTRFVDIKPHGGRELLKHRIGDAWFGLRRRWGIGLPARWGASV